ncbi:MAG: 3-oxo-tetronate kinase [Gammaproteobacteria bacterium]
MLLGCIADDFTGATDLANTLVRNGMRTIQYIDVPASATDDAHQDVDAAVVALKSRTIGPEEAVAVSLKALQWLRARGCKQFFFKYCSTFDSTPAGNIGPVAEALLDALGADFTIACPAFPENARTIFKGHLFVGDVLLSDSGMRHHPLTPMTDSNLVNVLAAQCKAEVGLVAYETVTLGAPAIEARFDSLRDDGIRHAIVDAVSDENLQSIGTACAGLRLITGGSGVAQGLAQNFRNAGLLAANDNADALPPMDGRLAVLSGSCSEATREQVERMLKQRPGYRVDPLAAARGLDAVAEALAFAGRHLDDGPVLIYATADPAAVKAVQDDLGRDEAGALVENVMAGVARGLVERGVRKLVVAGGETSGAVVNALAVKALRIGPQIDPGVPWTLAMGATPLALALKSGNFGGPDFFLDALSRLED